MLVFGGLATAAPLLVRGGSARADGPREIPVPALALAAGSVVRESRDGSRTTFGVVLDLGRDDPSDRSIRRAAGSPGPGGRFVRTVDFVAPGDRARVVFDAASGRHWVEVEVDGRSLTASMLGDRDWIGVSSVTAHVPGPVYLSVTPEPPHPSSGPSIGLTP